jgi:hypothetical protein
VSTTSKQKENMSWLHIMYFEINDMMKDKTKDAIETTQLCLLKTFIFVYIKL